MALVITVLADLKLYSKLAEVQALTADTCAPIEARAMDILRAELSRQLTVDAEDVARRLRSPGGQAIPLPECLHSVTSVVSDTLGDITAQLEITSAGWMLEPLVPPIADYHFTFYPGFRQRERVGFRHPLTITGKWGFTLPANGVRVLYDLIEAICVRGDDTVSRRDEIAPWGSVRDGEISGERDHQARKETLENLLRYDVKKALYGCYRPNIVVVM